MNISIEQALQEFESVPSYVERFRDGASDVGCEDEGGDSDWEYEADDGSNGWPKWT